MPILKFFVFFVFFAFLVAAQDAPSPAPVVDKVLEEVVAHRQILDQIVRTLNQLPVSEGLRKLDAANTKSQESLHTISETIRNLNSLVEHIPKRVAEEGSSSKSDFQTGLTSQISSLQTLLKTQQTSVDDLRTKLGTISEQTKGLDLLTKAQKTSAKQTELLEKLLENQESILANQKKIMSKLEDKSLGDTARLYYAKLCNGTHDVIKLVSEAFSSKKGSPTANLQKSAGAFLNQAGAFASKASAQGQDLVVKYHGELSAWLKTQGIPEPYSVYAATSILTIPLSVFALIIVSLVFRILRILGAIIFYPCYCCFRRRSRPATAEDGESKKRKSPESEKDQLTAAKPAGKKGKTH